METNLIENLVQVCRIFDKHSVEYIVVGGAAVALHGYFRRSKAASGLVVDKNDLDFWYDPTYDNYFRMLDALNELGQDVSRFKEEQAPDPMKSFFRIEREHFTLDLIPNYQDCQGLNTPMGNVKWQNSRILMSRS
jgi:hypothetical protein